MRRVALATSLLLLAFPARAGAWSESAGFDLPDDGIANCLRVASSVSGSQLALGSGGSPITSLLDVDAGALAPVATLAGRSYGCAAAAGVDGGQALLARWRLTRPGSWSDVVLQVAPPGSTMTTIRVVHGRVVTEPVIALAPGGAAVVAWSEQPFRSFADERLLASVRPSAGAPFGPPTRLGTLGGIEQRPGVGIDAAGRSTVAWLQDRVRPRDVLAPGPTQTVLKVATSTPDGRFGPPRWLGRSLGDRVALAETPDGRALLAADQVSGRAGHLAAYERLPGETRFAHVSLRSAGASGDGLAVTLAPEGGAAIAYRNDERSVFATLRPPGGAFGRWVTVVPLARSSGDSLTVSESTSLPNDDAGRRLQAALGAGGEVALTWVDDPRDGRAATAYAAYGTLAGGMERPQRIGSPCRPAADAAPLGLAGGRLAVAWADNAGAREITKSTVPSGGGRVHLALGVADATTPAAPAPRLSARLAGPRALGPGESLRVRVRCDAACDVRVAARARGVGGNRLGGGDLAIWLAASRTLRAGESAVVALPRFNGFNAAGARGRPRTPIAVSACALAGPLARRLELAPPRIADPPPLPRVVGLSAVRRGGTIRVTWRTVAPARGARFLVYTVPFHPRVGRSLRGGGHRRFAVTLHPGRRLVRRVVVDLASPALSFPLSFSARVA